jgi:hypothetical protein
MFFFTLPRKFLKLPGISAIWALLAHSAAEFNISPGRWQHVWLVAIVPPERWEKMDRNDCHTAWGNFKTLISSQHHYKNNAWLFSLISFFCLRPTAMLSAKGLESTFWHPPLPPTRLYWKCLLWHIWWPVNMNLDMNDMNGNINDMNVDMIWHEKWHDLTWITWFDMNYMIWHELHDLTWISWFDINNMIWDEQVGAPTVPSAFIASLGEW